MGEPVYPVPFAAFLDLVGKPPARPLAEMTIDLFGE